MCMPEVTHAYISLLLCIILRRLSWKFFFPIVISVLDWVCVFMNETIQRIDNPLVVTYLTKHHHC